jgi:hypothetical protein
MPHKRSPLPINRILTDRSAAVERLFRNVEFLNSINTLIREGASSKLAAHCSAAGIRDRQLVILVDSPAWATRLHFEQNAIMQRVRQQPDLNSLTGIQIKVRPTDTPPVNIVRKIEPLSAHTTADLRACADKINDPSLANALRRLAEHGSRQRKA